MHKTFCDNCNAEISNGVMMDKSLYDLCNQFSIKATDICAPCYSKLRTIIDSAIRKWRNGENK